MGVYIDGTPIEAFQEIGRGIRSKMREMMDASTFVGNVLLGFRGRIAEDGATLTMLYANSDDAIHSNDVFVKTVDDIFVAMEKINLSVCSEIYSPCFLEDTTSGVIFFYEDDSPFVLQNFLSLFGNLVEKRGDDSSGDKFLEYKENHSIGWADGFHIVGQADNARKSYVEWIEKFRYDFVGMRHVDFIYNERNWHSDFCALIPAQNTDEADCLEIDACWKDDELVLTSGEEPLDDDTPPFRRDVLNLPVLVDDFGVFVGAKTVLELSDYIEKYREVLPRLLGGFTCDVFRAVVGLSLKNG